MSAKEVVETVYGKYSKFEITREGGGPLTSAVFRIYKDGKYHDGPFHDLRDAVEAAEKER